MTLKIDFSYPPPVDLDIDTELLRQRELLEVAGEGDTEEVERAVNLMNK